MSSVAIIQQTEAIHLITDGAQYDTDGVVTALSSKVTILPLSNCAFAMRGASWPKDALAFALSFAQSFDDIVDMLPTLLRAMAQSFDRIHGQDAAPVSRNFEVTVAGWSERLQRMIAGVATTYSPCDPKDPAGLSFATGYEMGVAMMVGQAQTFPAIDIRAALGRDISSQDDIDAMDPEHDGFALHRAQRYEAGAYCGKAVYLVGGFAEITTIRMDGVSKKMLHEWPDVIGERINPEGAPPIEIAQALMDAAQTWDDARRAAAPIGEAA